MVDHSAGAALNAAQGVYDPTLYSYLTTFGELIVRGMIAYTLDGRVIHCNSGARRLLGLPATTPGSACGTHVTQRLYHPDGTPLTPEQHPWYRLTQGEQFTNHEILYRNDNGHLQSLYFTGALLRDAQGLPQVVLVLFHDALIEHVRQHEHSDLRQQIDALQGHIAHQSAQFEAVIASIPDGIAIVDTSGNLTHLNIAGQQILGGPPTAHLDDTVAHYAVRNSNGEPELPAHMPLSRALRGEQVVDLEQLVRGTSGPDTRIVVSANPIYGQNGSIIGAVAIFRDVTRQRLEEEERTQRLLDLEGLREIAQATGLARDERAIYRALVSRLAHLLHAERCALLILDEENNLLQARVPAFGWSEDELMRFRLPLVLFEQLSQERDPERPIVLDERNDPSDSIAGQVLQIFGVRNVMMARLMMRERLIALIGVYNKQRNEYFSEADMRLLQTVAPQAALAITSSRLYTRALRTTAEAQQRARELARANAELDAFTYSVSHDLRAPIRAIKGFSQILERELPELSARARHQFSRIQANVDKMSNLIEDLLAFSRAGRRIPDQQRVDTNLVVREALRQYAHDLQACGAQVQIADLPPVRGDSQLLEQVFANLVSNSIKYRRDTVALQIAISGTAQNGTTHLMVSDNGIGFDMRYHDKIFEVFQRLHGDAYEGTGVGLALVRKIVERHGGQIRAESTPGVGTTFVIELPMPQLEQEEQHDDIPKH